MGHSKVAVVARVRPINPVEQELLDSGAGEIIAKVADEKTLMMEQEKMSFIFDGAYENESQRDFFDKVARGTVYDAMQGYNGTIFAYGPTGTGKTYTMFGPNTSDPELMGIIPRTAFEIFEHVRKGEVEVEYEIRCGMLEIYKEELRDLLGDGYGNSELRIKENPLRGIYVHGLTERCIVNEQELLCLIHEGNKGRAVAETRSNQFSSRSHTIFLLQITQKYANGTEKRATLNLVDLAGSEKLSSTINQEQRVEETKKINKSLSALGNVIHALTNNSDHVPYRDSKLTRILQESLGGNFKTTLIFTISPFSLYKEETLSSIKFAQRARNVRNRVHVNVKQSTEEFYEMIRQLKTELYDARAELERLRLALSGSTDRLEPPDRCSLSSAESKVPATTDTRKFSFSNTDFTACIARKECPTAATVEKLVAERDMWELRATQLQTEVAELRGNVKEQEKLAADRKLKLIRVKRDLLQAEQRIKERESAELSSQMRERVRADCDENMRIQLEVLTSELQSVTKALEDSEDTCSKLFSEKRSQFRLQTSEGVAAVFKESRLGSYEALLSPSTHGISMAAKNVSDVVIPLQELALGDVSDYSKQLVQAISDGRVPLETQLFLVKQQLVEAAIYNHTLHNVAGGLGWRLRLEQQKARMKENYCDLLERCNQELDCVLNQTHEAHCSLRKRIERLETALSLQREEKDKLCQPDPAATKPSSFVIRSFTRRSLAPPPPHGPEEIPIVISSSATKESSPPPRSRFYYANGPGTADPSAISAARSFCCAQDAGGHCGSATAAEIERQRDDIGFLKTELSLQSARAEQLRKSFLIAKEHIAELKTAIAETEVSAQKAVKEEHDSWQQITLSLKVVALF